MNAKVIARFFAPQNEFPQAHVVYSEENKPLNSAQFPFLKRGEKGREQDMNSRRHLHMWEGKGGRKGTLHHNGRKTKGRKRYFPFGPQSRKKYFFPYLITTLSVKLGMFLFSWKSNSAIVPLKGCYLNCVSNFFFSVSRPRLPQRLGWRLHPLQGHQTVRRRARVLLHWDPAIPKGKKEENSFSANKHTVGCVIIHIVFFPRGKPF